ncbi:SDR family NAD(P)-dependent oxidoreductase [Halobellus limi]|uniref:NAD(P)-dependent dehydrogenase, short-chain alcohol dehydrogenase family n=1 Tax=Halobellus limi TaxID=699433 RepID=A0A1H6A086_9EURY|nr:SDR family NAD(P)-dependent oxidoreductase [Halobellus limi]QCC47857.1 SDR family oxidoreductase [Halobellus limi]SEG42183.1 NAD(P)-dependent dehydrogenase, short-chain alcohol dehydrogenase family [Halobellus limi]
MNAENTAVVTGAATGIGAAITERLAADGYHVVVADVADGSETVARVEAAGGSAEFREADVTDEDAMRSLFEGLDLDVLVNNAAYYAPLVTDKKRFDEIPSEEWDTVLAVNAKGTFLASKHALDAFGDGGSIVNISSSVVTMGVPGFLHYVASKGAVLAMTRAMAAEVGDIGVRVNAVMPGFTWSEASQQAGEEYLEDYVGEQDLDRVVEPEDIAGVVAFLASPDSGVMTGQAINADPGLSYY